MAYPPGRDHVPLVERVIGLEHSVAHIGEHLENFEAESADYRDRTRHHFHEINNTLTVIVGKLEKLERIEVARADRSASRRAVLGNFFKGLVGIVSVGAALTAVLEFLRSLRPPPH